MSPGGKEGVGVVGLGSVREQVESVGFIQLLGICWGSSPVLGGVGI